MTIPSWARVGAKVVCVDAAKWRRTLPLTTGRIYTIRHIGECPISGVGVYLEEIANDCNGFGEEYGYRLDRFRPLVDENIEATLFRSKGLHNRSPRKVGVDA